MAAMSWKRAGNSAARAARAMCTRPVSSGSRKASSAGRGYSGSSLQNIAGGILDESTNNEVKQPHLTSQVLDEVQQRKAANELHPMLLA